jgi:hypothetical protein
MNHRGNNGKVTASLPNKLQSPVDYDGIRMYNKHTVLFIWLDELEDEFQYGSFTIARALAKDRERWGKVVKVHPTSCVPVGSYIKPLHVHEPFGSVINGLEHWMTYDEHVDVYTFDYEATKSFCGEVEKLKLANPEKDMK